MMPAYNTIHGRSATFGQVHAYVLAAAKILTAEPSTARRLTAFTRELFRVESWNQGFLPR